MDVFYLGPPLALIVLTAATCPSRTRLIGAWVIAVGATVFAFHGASEWGYWTAMVAFLAIGLACAWPGRAEVGIFGDERQILLAVEDSADRGPAVAPH
jgi:predicted branched-subunit amino acid permease